MDSIIFRGMWANAYSAAVGLCVSSPAMETNAPRIVVVDDNRDIAEGLAIVLEAHGFEVHAGFDGGEGLRLIETLRPVAAIIDIGMPILSGYEVARQVRQRLGPAVRLIAVTGWGQLHDVAMAFEAGFDHHFTKPADPDELVRLVREYAADRVVPG